MPKIIKNGREYSGTPLEEVTAWPPTGDSVQIEQPLMGNTDISGVGDGTVTGAISELNTGLTYQLLTSFVGNQSVNLPAVFHELYILASLQTGGSSFNRTIYLIKNVLSDTYQHFYSGDSGGRISTHISKTAIDTIEYYDGSTDRTVNTTFAIYYR